MMVKLIEKEHNKLD